MKDKHAFQRRIRLHLRLIELLRLSAYPWLADPYKVAWKIVQIRKELNG